MLDSEKLVQAAAAAVIGALTKVAAEPALSAGAKVWGWLKGQLGGTNASVAADVEAEPARPSSASKVNGLLQDLLHDEPGRMKELQQLLDEGGGSQAIAQTANASGGSVVAQIVGSGNSVSTGKG
ncbi:MAG: hypothetical protein PGN33_18725 [Methylobacterium radiotolerans]